MEKKPGYYSVLASIATSVLILIQFYVFALQKMEVDPEMYKLVDIYAGMVYVFILSMIVSASIWPGIIEKRLKE